MSLTSLFVDFDAYFASAEQHLQPHLRGKPVGVAPILAETSCCIAASYEAKAQGVKTGPCVYPLATFPISMWKVIKVGQVCKFVLPSINRVQQRSRG